MADVQKQFSEFHKTIRTDYEDNSTLREKRDIIVTKIRKYLKDNELPSFEVILQGSYKTKTGIYPINNNDYDIDLGLIFNFNSDEYGSSAVRSWVYEAIKNHTSEVLRKDPCIRVNYADNYHVDIVVYSKDKFSYDGKCLKLGHRTRKWIDAEPQKLIEYFENKRLYFNGTEDSSSTDQLRRCIRYLKRWSDFSLPISSRISGLAILILSSEQATKHVNIDGVPNDISCLKEITQHCSNLFSRITINKPTQEYEDLLSKISDDNMEILKKKFEELDGVLIESNRSVDPHEACKLLRGKFGDDFPVPPKENTSDRSPKPAIITSSNSALK